MANGTYGGESLASDASSGIDFQAIEAALRAQTQAQRDQELAHLLRLAMEAAERTVRPSFVDALATLFVNIQQIRARAE